MSGDADLGLRLPLSGLRLVEASAGTGKTFTLATLYVRAVVEAGLPVASLLAVTFTEAATQELRLRIRDRLRLAARLAEGEAADPGEAEHLLTQSLVQAALAREPPAALRQRLRLAAEAMDLAPVFTIHAFCRRVLADHALEAGQAPGELELLKNERALREEVAVDLWRAACADPADARVLMARWKSPEALAATLSELRDLDELRPAPPSADAAGDRDLPRAFEQAGQAVAAAFQAHGKDTRSRLHAAIERGWMHATHFSRARFDLGWASLATWAEGGGVGMPAQESDQHKRFLLAGSAEIEAKTGKKHKGEVAALRSPLTDAIDRWEALRAESQASDDHRLVALVHRLRREAGERLAALKRQRRQQGFDDLIRGVADALAGATGEALAERLRAQYRIAFVDEFQDTDPAQWAIFRRLFAEAPAEGGHALFLIGDPKQAIYRFRGGDVHTYLDAARQAATRDTLQQNFRSRPIALQAVQWLYAGAGEQPFGEPGIAFVEVAGGGKVADGALRRDGAVAPALEFSTWGDADGTPKADAARELAAAGAVAAIRGWLAPGRTLLQDKHDAAARPPRPGDVAVLVETHQQARLVQRVLVRAGLPCVVAGRDSLFASDEAADLRALFEACLHPADDARLRAALATPLLGQDAGAIAALDADGAAHRAWQDRAQAWRQRWERHGPLALVGDLCAASGPRLLGLEDGERRLSNWLQLAESLQSLAAGRDVHATADLLADRIAHADSDNEEELLRLESDADRIRILTLHKSKGLEFPLVCLPFLAFGGRPNKHGDLPLARFHEGLARVAHMKCGDEAAWKAAQAQDERETRAEKRRLLYVGLTRARLATWAAFGPVQDADKTALAALLWRDQPPKNLDAGAIRVALASLAALAPEAITVDAVPSDPLPGGVPSPPVPVTPPVERPTRRFIRDWWVHSFSGLAREDAGGEERQARDEGEPLPSAAHFAGARFGNVLHEALERVDPAAWTDWRETLPPPGQAAPLEQALRNGGYGSAGDLAEGLAALSPLVRDTLNVRLPEGTRLCELGPPQRRAELEFHFALAPTRVPALLELLHAHGLLAARQAFGARERLEGLVTGFIDLVYEYDGRVYLLDYKSNQLPAYDAAALAEAVAHSEYDLQYVLYTLALHRWLRFRRPGYDYDAHFGGVRYLFCRGLQPGRDEASGVHAVRLPRVLVEALDALLSPAGEGGAA